jgi:hypothetical protein
MNPFPDAADAEEPIPVTVWLTRAQAVRLEVLIGAMRATSPELDDNDITDALFDTGLSSFESIFRLLEPLA